MKLSNVKPAENHYLRKKTAEFLGTGQECKDGLLPSVKHNIWESLEMWSPWYIRILRVYLIPLCLWWSIIMCYVSATTIWFLSHLCCLYCRRYDHCLVCFDTFVVLSGIYPFSAVNPGFFIRMNWDSPWYLVELVADGTIIYDAYSTLTVSVASVLLFYQWAVKGMGSEPVSLTLQ